MGRRINTFILFIFRVLSTFYNGFMVVILRLTMAKISNFSGAKKLSTLMGVNNFRGQQNVKVNKIRLSKKCWGQKCWRVENFGLLTILGGQKFSGVKICGYKNLFGPTFFE